MTLTSLQTDKGPAYVDLSRVEFISTTFRNRQGQDVRTVGLYGGNKAYILDTIENHDKLLALLPIDAPKMANAPRLKKVRAASI